MSKIRLIKVKDNGKVKVPLFLKLRDRKNINYTLDCKNKNIDSLTKKQVNILIKALNIKNKKDRLSYIYDASCDLLDNDFYPKNVCNFKNNKCMHDRKHSTVGDGCCSDDNGNKCMYLVNHRCSVKCLACKFHMCYMIKNHYKPRDILVMKYLLNWKQRIMCYLNFFMTKEEVMNDLLRNSIILWTFRKNKERFL